MKLKPNYVDLADLLEKIARDVRRKEPLSIS
jgi:hypothetical protein